MQWQATVRWDVSQCRKCDETADCFASRPVTCSAWVGGAERRCCPLPTSLISTEKCSPRGESCYEPVLGSLSLVLVLVLVLLCWTSFICCVGLWRWATE